VDLIQAYNKEREGQITKKPFFFSKELALKVSYFFLPCFLTSFVLWILLGIFILIKSTPYLGTFLGIILAFFPFLINLGIHLLFLVAFLILFFFTPLLALNKNIDRRSLITRLRVDLFTHLLLLGFAVFPVWIVWMLSAKAAALTFSGYAYGDNLVVIILQGLFILIPFSTIMALPIIFFFNFSLEAYLITMESDDKFVQENTSDFS